MLRYLLLDVFCEKAFTGNPLAVVPFPKVPLSQAAMQAVAAEFNLSETVFIFPPETEAGYAQLRIFTPAEEVPFAGHPTIGTVVALGLLGKRNELPSGFRQSEVFVLEEGVGPIHTVLEQLHDDGGRARLQVAQLPMQGPKPPERDILSAILGLEPSDLLHDVQWHPEAYSCGVPFLFIPLKDRQAVDRARLNTALWEKNLSQYWAPLVFIFSADAVDPRHTAYGRMFGPDKGIVEDPATGAAAAAFAGYLGRRFPQDSGSTRWTVEQGYAMGRPSLLHLEVLWKNGALAQVALMGSAVLVGEGSLRVIPQLS